MILDDPLAEALGLDRGQILAPGERGGFGARRLGRGGRDAVNHGRGEGDLGGDPVRERRIKAAGEVDHRAAQQHAVVRQVVAAEHGEGRQTRRAAPVQRLGQQAKHALRRVRRGQIGCHRRVLRVAALRGPVEAVGLFGDRQRDDPRRPGGHRGEHRLGVSGRADGVGDGADHPRPRALGALLDQGIEPVLRVQLFGSLRRAQRHPEDAPVAARGRQREVGQRRLMRLVEGAKPEMHDADPVVGGGVARAPRGGHLIERGQPHVRPPPRGDAGRHGRARAARPAP